jgi:hypothetical protein
MRWSLSGLPRFPCGLGGSLLSFLLRRAFAGAENLATNPDGRLESFVMVGTALSDLVVRGTEPIAGCGFLQPSLIVRATWTERSFLDVGFELGNDEIGGRFDAAVEIDRTDDRLGGVSQDRSLVSPAGRIFAFTEAKSFSQAQGCTDFGECRSTHDGCPRLGEVSFGKVREASKEMIGHNQLQDGIAEEFEAFVGGLTVMFCTP